MKARVKATGEIVDVIAIDGDWLFCSDGAHYGVESLEGIDHEIDYWTRLEHQYAGMAMQGILSNPEYLRSLMHTKHDDYRVHEVVPNIAVRLSHALIQKLKEKEERK